MSDAGMDKNVTVGVALGSGAARGWAHIGVLQELHEMGIRPKVVVGTSIGAIVGATYAGGHLATMEQWALQLNRRRIFRLLDFSFRGGGLVGGQRLMSVLTSHMGSHMIEHLPVRYAAIATRLSDGRELWLRKGNMVDAVRASMAIPGIFTPVKYNGHMLVDGGLCNPVPVSVCRALGADVVIAVNLHGDRRGFQQSMEPHTQPVMEPQSNKVPIDKQSRKERLTTLFGDGPDTPESGRKPGVMNAINLSIDIMQTRIIRSRLAGDAPEVLVTPRLSHVNWLEFERAEEAIAEGREAVRRVKPVLEYFLTEHIAINPKPSPMPRYVDLEN